MRRRAWTLLVLAVFALLGAATASDDEASEGEEGEPASAALRALEAHLSNGEDYGEGPDGELVARAVRDALAPGDAVAVRVVPGTPRRIVAIVRYSPSGGYQNLREIPSAERNEELDRVIAAIDQRYEAGGDELGVAIRGAVFYGAIALRGVNQEVRYHTGAVISTDALEPLLTGAPGPEPDHAIEVGSSVIGAIEAAPRPQPFYHLTIGEPSTVRVRFLVDRTDDPPIAALCVGTLRAPECDDQRYVEPLEALPEELIEAQLAETDAAEARGETFSEDVYRLRPGSYTIAVFRGCDEGACENEGARFSLELR